MMQVEGYRIHQWHGRLQWEQFSLVPPGPGEALVQLEACSVGLTVLNCIRGDLADDPALLPRVPGHELVGRVQQIGPGVDNLQIGQRVMAYFYLSCACCPACYRGADSLCENLAGWVGIHRDGGYASHTVLPAKNLLPLPENIEPALATAVPDAVATSLHVCRSRAQIQPGDRVVVIGAGGGVGIHMVQMARLFGGEVVGLEVMAEKFPIIRDMGARPVTSQDFSALDAAGLFPEQGPTVVIDLIGNRDSLEWSLNALTPDGRMVVLTTFRDIDFLVSPRQLVFRQIDLLGSRYASKAELLESAALVASKRIQAIVTDIVPPEEVESVHEKLRNGKLIGRGAIDWTNRR